VGEGGGGKEKRSTNGRGGEWSGRREKISRGDKKRIGTEARRKMEGRVRRRGVKVVR
jgi:hypothetical protein